MERGFFDHVLDAFEGFVDDALGEPHSRTHRRGLKVWFGGTDDRADPEHYEAQLISADGSHALEIGFHAEHRREEENEAALARLDGRPSWRRALGPSAESGEFLGMGGWRRISEVWEPPDPDDPEAPIEVAARLADYVDALEAKRRATLNQ